MAGVGLLFAILGLVAGIFGFSIPIMAVIGLPVSVLGLIFAIAGGKKNPGGVATAGLVISILATIFTAITFFSCGICVLCAAGTIGTII